MRGEGPFAVIRLEPVRRVAGEVGNQAVGVFLEAPHICSISSPILQHLSLIHISEPTRH